MFRVADLVRDADLLPLVHDIGERLQREAPGIADRLVERWIGGAARYASASGLPRWHWRARQLRFLPTEKLRRRPRQTPVRGLREPRRTTGARPVGLVHPPAQAQT